jgi:hypothetical protein
MSAREVWSSDSDAILRGLVHSLNNRVAAIEATAATIEEMDANALRESLEVEGERLRSIAVLARSLASDGETREEACSVSEMLSEAVELAQLHPSLRDADVKVHGAEALPATRAVRSDAVRAMVLGLLAVGEAGPSTRSGRQELTLLCQATPEGDAQVQVRCLTSASGDGDLQKARVYAANSFLADSAGALALEVRGNMCALVIRMPALRRPARGAAP